MKSHINLSLKNKKAIVYNLVVSLGNMNISIKKTDPAMSKEETLTLFNELNGCIKAPISTHVDKDILGD